MQGRHRRPMLWMALMLLTVLLGIGSRRFGALLPPFVTAYAGDTLWATFVFLGFGLVLPRTGTRRVAVLALVCSLLIELSQLYHARWIDTLRHTTLGGLVLGYGFLWSDLVCYAVGVGLGALIERTMGRSGTARQAAAVPPDG